MQCAQVFLWVNSRTVVYCIGGGGAPKTGRGIGEGVGIYFSRERLYFSKERLHFSKREHILAERWNIFVVYV